MLCLFSPLFSVVNLSILSPVPRKERKGKGRGKEGLGGEGGGGNVYLRQSVASAKVCGHNTTGSLKREREMGESQPSKWH